MALPLVPDSARVEIRYLYASQKVMNTLWFRNTGAFMDDAQLEIIAGVVGGWWETHLRPLQGTHCQVVEFFAQAKDGSGLEHTVLPDPLANAGTLESTAVPNNVTLCVSFRTGLSGRSYRGRNYVPGIVSSQINGNYATAAYAGDVVEAYTALIAEVASTDWVWGVCSMFNNNEVRPEGAVTAISNVVCSDLALDSQRRRLVGRGD